MNRVILVGNLTRDPELTTTSNGVSLCRFGLAVQRRFAGQDGEREADFFNIVVWRGQADNCYKYLKKGSKCGIVGSLQTRSYDAQDGTKRYSTDVVAEEVEFLSTKGSSNSEESFEPVESGSKSTGKSDVVNKFEPIDDDNLPF
ncbi:MAG: single-stranded DNA-binding protein [Clostridia bacterium]|nr:single-stranded DNA-binding protein [Clostridia bacterium]